MRRKIVHIHEEKCNGCGACANACHENAIVMVDGKAILLSDHYCDGLGDCLPACPTGAIEIIDREAVPYNEEAVKERQKSLKEGLSGKSRLMQWPIQIKLVPVTASYFEDARLLIAADCTAYAYASFNEKFIKNNITLIGCPKLDNIDYSEKLAEIISKNNIKNITIVRMEVPCCGGIEYAVKSALEKSGKLIPWQVYTISINGDILD